MSEQHPKLVAYESILRRTTRLRVLGLRWEGDPPGDPVWGEVAGDALPTAIELLAARLEIVALDADDASDGEDGSDWACECEPVCFYELYEGRRRLAVIEFHGAGHMMLRDHAGIFDFVHGDAIARWLAARGIALKAEGA